MTKPITTFERRQHILQLLQEQTSVRVTDLAADLEVSEGTIRNDLEALDAENQLRRVRGGAVARTPLVSSGEALRVRALRHSDQKRWLAQWAAGMIESGDVILLDASTTVLYIASFLEDRRNLTVFTNGLEVGRLLAANPSHTVILLGGILRTDGNAVISGMDAHLLRDLHIRTAFVSCAAFSPQSGFMENDLREAQLKSQMLGAAQRRIALVDASKIGQFGLAPFASLADMDHVVTDSDTPRPIIEEIRRANTAVTVCNATTVSTFTSYDTKEQSFKIGFANLDERLPFCRDVRRGLERAAQKSGRVELIAADNQLNPDVALTVADDFIGRGVDLMIEYQVDAQAGNLLAHKFKQAEIPVIAVDIPMIGATFLGVDNYGVGYVAGEALGEAIQNEWGGHLDYLIVLEHLRTGDLPAMRIRGQLDGLFSRIAPLSAEQIIRLDSGNRPEVSQEQMYPTLQKLPHARHIGVICFNDEAAIGALEAARALNRSDDLLIVGQGADRRLRQELRQPNPRIIGSTAFHPEYYGETLIEIALKILAGEPVPPAVYIEHTFINAENVDHYYPSENETR